MHSNIFKKKFLATEAPKMENEKHQKNKTRKASKIRIQKNLKQNDLTCIDKIKQIIIHAKLLYRSDIKRY